MHEEKSQLLVTSQRARAKRNDKKEDAKENGEKDS